MLELNSRHGNLQSSTTKTPVLIRIAYFIDMFEEDVPSGLLGPLPESQATRLNTVITNNNNWLTYFIIFSFII